MQFVRQNSSSTDLTRGGQAAHLTTEARERIVERLKDGVPVARIALEFSVASNTIYRIRAAMPGRRRAAHAPSELVSFRVSAAEKQAFDAAVARGGFKDRSDALRALVRNSVGLLDRNFAFVGEVKAVYDELSAIGVNINQIARAVNRGQAPPLGEAAEDLARLRSQLRQVLPVVNEVVAEARRSNERLWAAARDATGDDGEAGR